MPATVIKRRSTPLQRKFAWTHTLTLSAGYTLAGTPDPGVPALPDNRMFLDGRWP